MTQVIHLAYHHIWKPEDGPKSGKDACDYERFIRQMEWLKRSEWTVLTSRQFMERPKKNGPSQKIATLSFDDGLRSQYTHAFPVLCSFGFPATFFIISCTLEGQLTPGGRLGLLFSQMGTEWVRDQMITELEGSLYRSFLDQLFPMENFYNKEKNAYMRKIKVLLNHLLSPSRREEVMTRLLDRAGLLEIESKRCLSDFVNCNNLVQMEKTGMEIGSHSVSHPFMGGLSLEEAEGEFKLSLEKIRVSTGAKVTSFAWPIGGKLPLRITEAARGTYRSAWNYSMQPVDMQPPYYPMNIPRVDETCFEQVTGATL